ncbi:MAG: methyl-accepting chemotaxis protein [Deltaproteobacteria bacterium]|nr:methyl-accepting chemotaxis protein [Deltaproteobacteria bacterium]
MSESLTNKHSLALTATAIIEAIDSIHATIAALQTTNAEAEDKFVSLGTGLQELFTNSSEMTNAAERSLNTVSQDNNISLIISGISNQILTRFSQAQVNDQKILEHATRTSELIKDLINTTPEIRQIDKELWILGSNMAIQSSWNIHTEKMFGEYSEELKQFSKSIKAVFLEFQNDLNGMYESIQKLQFSIRSETQRLEDLIVRSQRNVLDATQQLEQLLADSAKKIQFVREQSRIIADKVAHVVTSIQFNDITRQQIEHVIEALKEIHGNEKAFDVYRCMRIQSAQLNQVASTLHTARETISASFTDIIRTGEATANQYQAYEIVEHGDSPFSKIKGALSELDELLKLSATLREQTFESMQIASIASDRLASHLDKISEITGELNLQAINALVMSRNIGDGGASLVALSKEVHSLSKESTTTVEQVVHILTEIGKQTSELSTLASEDATDDHSFGVLKGFEQIDEISSMYYGAVMDTASRCSRLQQQALQTREKSEFIQELSSRFRNIHLDMERSAELLSEHVVLEEDVQSNLRDRYTMESERQVHDRVHGELTGTFRIPQDTQSVNSTTLSSAAAASGDDELGDFELF